MKGIIFLLTLFLVAGPVISSVDISCTVTGPNEVTVSFSTSGETELVRMISLDVQVNDPNVYIADINCVSAGYYIHPGSISIDSNGNVDDLGSCAGVLDGNSMTSEQGSLYVGAVNSPAEGALFIVTLGGCTGGCGGGDETVTVSVSENVLRRGVVMEDPDLDPTVNLTGCAVNIGECPSADCCACLGDVSDLSGSGPPDGTVNFGDLMAIYTEMINQYPNGDPILQYAIWPPYLPVGFECADIDGSGSINITDLMTIYTEMINQYPHGDFHNPWYDIGCPF